MKLFKHLTLIFTSLLVVALSFNFTKLYDSNTSVQNKAVSYQLAILPVDDIDDDLADEFEIATCDQVTCHSPCNIAISEETVAGFGSTNSSVPFYIQIRNLRI